MLLRELQKYPNPPFLKNAEYLRSTLLSECNRNFSIHLTVKDLIQQLMHLTRHLLDCALNKKRKNKAVSICGKLTYPRLNSSYMHSYRNCYRNDSKHLITCQVLFWWTFSEEHHLPYKPWWLTQSHSAEETQVASPLWTSLFHLPLPSTSLQQTLLQGPLNPYYQNCFSLYGVIKYPLNLRGGKYTCRNSN